MTPPAPDASAAPARAGSLLGPEHRTVTVGMVVLITLVAFEALAVATAMPVVAADLGGLELYAVAFAGPVAAGVVGMVAAGGWTDRAGPGTPLLTGVELFCAGLLVAGSAAVMPVLVVGRVVQGLGAGLVTVALYVTVARVFPDALRPRVFAAFAAAWVLPSVVGPAVAGLVAERLGWRWVFLAVPVLAVPAALALRPTLRQVGRAGAGTAPTPWGRLGRAVAAAVAVLVLHAAGQGSGLVTVVVVVVAGAVVAVALPGLVPRGTLRAAPGLPAVVLTRGLLGAAFFGAEVYLPLLLTSRRDLTPAQAGLVLTAAALAWSTGSWLRGRADRWDDRLVVGAGALAIVLGTVVAASALWDTVPVPVAIAGWALGGLGMGVSYPTLSVLTLRLARPSEQGTASSSLQVMESLAIALVLAVSGPVFARLVQDRPTTAFLAGFALALAPAVVAGLVAGRVLPRDREGGTAASGPAA